MKTVTQSSPALTARTLKTRQSAPFLAQPAFAPWHEAAQLFTHDDQPWLLVPAERDPLRTLKGQVVIPAKPLAQLQRVANSGTHFDRIAIAHELDPAAIPAKIRDVISAEGLPCTDDVATKLVGTKPPPPASAARMARGLDRVISALGSVAAAPSALTLDPIVFGVIGAHGAPSEGGLVAYFPLAAWHW